jgi:hypothetical protein
LVFGIAGSANAQWLQFNHDAQHSGFLSAVQGQNLDTIRFSKLYDSAASGSGELLIHYDVPKVDELGNAYIVLRDRVSGQITYSVQKLDSSGTELWTYTSDYRLVIGGGWEASFSFVVGNGQVYVAGLYGIVHVLSTDDGSWLSDIYSYAIPDPIPPGLASGVAVSGPPSIDADGTLYYVVRSTFTDVRSHLAKMTVDSTVSAVDFADLTGETSERPGLNAGPAVGPDGTIYVGSVKTASPIRFGLLAVNPDLTLKWIGDMASDPLHVARIIDQSTSNPLVGPDGRVFYGGHNSNEVSDGYLYEFSANGDFQAEFPFGWDSTPAVYPDPDGDPTHYHLIEKKNMYGSGRYYLVSIDPNGMTQEWSWELPTTGRELCVNAVVVDSTGASYFLGEDGYFYRVEFGGVNWSRIMLGAPRDAAYTPAAMGPDGTVYALDDRSFYIVGNQ